MVSKLWSRQETTGHVNILIQKIVMDVQWDNAAAMATIPLSLEWAEFTALPT